MMFSFLFYFIFFISFFSKVQELTKNGYLPEIQNNTNTKTKTNTKERISNLSDTDLIQRNALFERIFKDNNKSNKKDIVTNDDNRVKNNYKIGQYGHSNGVKKMPNILFIMADDLGKEIINKLIN